MLMSVDELGPIIHPPILTASQQHLVSEAVAKNQEEPRTRLEKRLTLVILLLGVLVFILMIALVTVYSDYRKEAHRPKTLCTKPECIESGSEILQSLDRAVDPCHNFYQFACGNWIKSHPIPEGRQTNSWFSERLDSLQRQVRDILERNTSTNGPKAINMMKILYKSCTDTDELEKLELGPLQQVLQDLGLSIKVPTTAQDFNLSYSIARAQKILSLDILIQLSWHHVTNSTAKILLVSPATGHSIGSFLPDPDEDPPAHNLGPKEILQATLVYVRDVLHYIDSWRTEDPQTMDWSRLVEVANKIMLYHTSLGNMTQRHNSQYLPNIRQMTFSELQKILDENSAEARLLDLEKYVTVLCDGLNCTVDYNNDVVSVSNLPYFVHLVQSLSAKKMVVVQCYIWWVVVQSLIPYTNHELRDIYSKFHEKIGTVPQISRSKECVKKVKSLMPVAVTYSMAEQYPINDTIVEVKQILVDIRTSFYTLIKNAPWMDQVTKTLTLDKAKSVTSFVGYPEWIGMPEYLDHHYHGVVLIEGEYMRNIITIKSKLVKNFLESFGNTNVKDPTDIALNYGAIGAILGHELTHGFDSDGKDYDKYGKRVPWWNNDMVTEYNKRASCFVEQYNHFRLPKRKRVDGKYTLAENIADNGGLKEAFLAYNHFLQRNGPEPHLPGLEEFSQEQLLFLGYANLWCHASHPLYESAKDLHSPAQFRVVGALSNMPDFATAWNCPENSTMNPRNKCVIW